MNENNRAYKSMQELISSSSIKIPLGAEGYYCAPFYWVSEESKTKSGPFYLCVVGDRILEFSLTGHLMHTWPAAKVGGYIPAWIDKDKSFYIDQLERVVKELFSEIRK